MNPDERHRTFADRFTRVTEGVTDWDAPTPVAEWQTRDVVDHLVTWFGGFLETGAGIRLPDHADAVPSQRWAERARDVQALLDDPPDRPFRHPQIGELPVDVAVDRFYTSDVFMHTWDLARASGQDVRLDPEVCAELLAGMEAMEDVIRASGQYGARVDVPATADVQTRLIAFIGRDPAWQPPQGEQTGVHELP